MLIAQLTNPFLVPVEEIIAIFCEARGFLAKTIGRPFCVGHMTYHVIFLAPQALLWCLRAVQSVQFSYSYWGNSWIMVLCAACGCNNMTDMNLSDKRRFYTIPNLNIQPEKRNLAAQWLHNIGTGVSSQELQSCFIFKRVCKDHFEASCFLDDMQARLMGY